jgi:cell division protein FtsN
MTNKYIGATKKPRSSSRSSKSFSKTLPKLPNFGPVAFGLIIGIALTSFLFSKFTTSDINLNLKIPSNTLQASQQAKAKPKTIAKKAEVEVEVHKEPRFDFYTELTKSTPEFKHDSIVKQPTVAVPAIPILTLKTIPKPIDKYLVQAGSFEIRADADALKARLTLNGLEAKIESVKLNDGKLWHRVILGPFKTEAAAQENKLQLKALAIDGILVAKQSNN